ncbi:hypothetical protein Q4517_14520 [Tenacibaculum sp. 1_MG-2023]|uniref:hypothetical protein n=1 Tax=Tenacibaculum sp. 1_MG-2023 TaxID=3062653 RepID=UPI0026E27195|nr:hypothetical protein [Tenacibaculum sp. 1_MG-2023]MDO6676760.1 hypothetical protein [Tenacibaculum sp. 1_MG-2023]
MKHFALFPLIFLFLVLNCKNYSSKKSQNDFNSSQSISKTQDYYFTVNFEFTKEDYQLISKSQNEGDLLFDIQTPTDMFLVAYKNKELFFYSELNDPLTIRPVGEREMEKTIENGSENINLPKKFARKNNIKNLEIYIYKVNGYIEDFDTEVYSKEKISQLEKEKLIKKKYTINAKQLVNFLNQ